MNKKLLTPRTKQSFRGLTSKLSARWSLLTLPAKPVAQGTPPPKAAQLEGILRKLISFHSVTGDQQGTHEALNYIANFVKERGMHVERYEWDDFESLFATGRPGVKKPKVLLAAHVDVVPADDDMFELRKAQGKLYGRGVYDMKFAIAAYLQAIDDLGDELKHYDIGLMVTSDEEFGGKDGQTGVQRLIAEGYRSEVVILPDGGLDWQLEAKAKGFAEYTLEAHGKSAHGSRPWEGDNAVIKLAQVLNELVGHFKDQGPGTDTINVGVIQGGETVNKIPDFASAEIEFRLCDKGSLKREAELIEKICKKYGVACIKRIAWDPTFNDINHPYVRTFANHIEEVTHIKNTGVFSNGGSDARFFAELGIPYVTTYLPGGGFHSPDEWISEDALHQFKQILSRYLDDVAKTKRRTRELNG